MLISKPRDLAAVRYDFNITSIPRSSSSTGSSRTCISLLSCSSTISNPSGILIFSLKVNSRYYPFTNANRASVGETVAPTPTQGTTPAPTQMQRQSQYAKLDPISQINTPGKHRFPPSSPPPFGCLEVIAPLSPSSHSSFLPVSHPSYVYPLPMLFMRSHHPHPFLAPNHL